MSLTAGYYLVPVRCVKCNSLTKQAKYFRQCQLRHYSLTQLDGICYGCQQRLMRDANLVEKFKREQRFAWQQVRNPEPLPAELA